MNSLALRVFGAPFGVFAMVSITACVAPSDATVSEESAIAAPAPRLEEVLANLEGGWVEEEGSSSRAFVKEGDGLWFASFHFSDGKGYGVGGAAIVIAADGESARVCSDLDPEHPSNPCWQPLFGQSIAATADAGFRWEVAPRPDGRRAEAHFQLGADGKLTVSESTYQEELSTPVVVTTVFVRADTTP